MLTWLMLEAIDGKKSTMGAMGGAVNGLVCITPASGFDRYLSASGTCTLSTKDHVGSSGPCRL